MRYSTRAAHSGRMKNEICEYVRHHQGASINNIAHNTGITVGYVRKYLDELEARGIVSVIKTGDRKTAPIKVTVLKSRSGLSLDLDSPQTSVATPTADPVQPEQTSVEVVPSDDVEVLVSAFKTLEGISLKDPELSEELHTLTSRICNKVKGSIKPCPFCKSSAAILVKVGNDYAIHCTKCGIRAAVPGGMSALIGAWNRRE